MFAYLAEHSLLLALTGLLPAFPNAGQVCLVGGAIRDLLLGRSPKDFDFACAGDPTPLARAFAGTCGGHWFWLDRARRQSRVLIADVTFDFAPWRAATLSADLAARDFSINTMALDLAVPLTVEALLDPLGGRADLAARLLSAAGPRVLADDPLRLLKGVRHVAELGLRVDAATLLAMGEAAPALATVAAERVRAEFWRILIAPQAPLGLALLAESGAGEVLFSRRFDAEQATDLISAWHCTRAALAGLANALPAAAARLAEPLEQGLSREGLLLWHAVVGRLDPALPLRQARTWRCSRATVQRMTALVAGKELPWGELQTVPRRARPLSLWALQYGPDPRDLFYQAAINNHESAVNTDGLIDRCIAKLEEEEGLNDWPPLVDGHWLVTHVGLSGPDLGNALAAVRRAEIRGEVNSPDEARIFLRASFLK
jgi:poly(A) polymerase